MKSGGQDGFRFHFQAAEERWTPHTHTWLVELRNFEAIKFDIWNGVLIKDSMLPAGTDALGTNSDMHT